MLTITLITNNNYQQVKEFIQRFTPLADSFLIANTGTHDLQSLISEKVKIEKFSWCDDFSAARNFLLEKVKEGWIMMLDIDNKMQNQDQIRLKLQIKKTKADVIFLPCIFHNQKSIEPKIWHSKLNLRYKYPVHEQLQEPKNYTSISTDCTLNLGECDFFHYYKSRKKYVQIMKKYLDKHPNDQRMQYYLASDYNYLRKHNVKFSLDTD